MKSWLSELVSPPGTAGKNMMEKKKENQPQLFLLDVSFAQLGILGFFLPAVPGGGTVSLQIDFLSFSFFSFTPLNFWSKDDLCGYQGWVGGGGGVGWGEGVKLYCKPWILRCRCTLVFFLFFKFPKYFFKNYFKSRKGYIYIIFVIWHPM